MGLLGGCAEVKPGGGFCRIKSRMGSLPMILFLKRTLLLVRVWNMMPSPISIRRHRVKLDEGIHATDAVSQKRKAKKVKAKECELTQTTS